MIALVRYSLSMLVRSQAYIAPFVLFGTALVVLTTDDHGTLPNTYSACAMTIFISALWFTIAVVNTEDRAQRSMTVVAARGHRRVLLANILAATVVCVGLATLGLVYPIVAGPHLVTVTDLAVGALAQLACAFAGIAGGLLCSRIVIPKAGYAVFASLGVLGVMLLVRPVPPVSPIMVVLSGAGPARTMLVPIAELGAIALGMLVASAVVAGLVARGQD